MKKLSIMAAVLLLTIVLGSEALAIPGESCAVFGENLTLSETDNMLSLFGTERGTAMEQTLSASEAAEYIADAPQSAVRTAAYLTAKEGGTGLSVSLSGISGSETAFIAALTAAGMTDVTVTAAAPEETAMLAVLPAVFKAYETLTCTAISPESREAAAATLREADAVAEEMDASQLEELLGAMTDFFEEISAMDDTQLDERIRSVAAEKGITLNDSQVQQLRDLVRKIQSLGGNSLTEHMQDLPDTVEKIRETGETAVQKAGSVWSRVRAFLEGIAQTLSALFS